MGADSRQGQEGEERVISTCPHGVDRYASTPIGVSNCPACISDFQSAMLGQIKFLPDGGDGRSSHSGESREAVVGGAVLEAGLSPVSPVDQPESYRGEASEPVVSSGGLGEATEGLKDIRDDILALRNLRHLSGYASAPGVSTFEIYHRDFATPIAIVWYTTPASFICDIGNIYVEERLRRCGLGTMLVHRILRQDFDCVVTGCANDQSTGLLAKMGFQRRATGTAWIHNRNGLGDVKL